MIDFNYWPFFFLAIFGAIVANATGAGGGVVFVPAFNMLGIGPESIIATSFAIQCFGMTAGTVAWRKHAKLQLTEAPPHQQDAWGDYLSLIVLFAVPAIIGLLMGQYLFEPDSSDQVKVVFKSFSAVFGITILLTTAMLARQQKANLHAVPFTWQIKWLSVMVGLLGGLITAWLSIGVGELVAVMLILLRYPVRLAIGVAVSVSAICVWFGVQKFLWFTPNINLDVLVFAAPAAIIGGTVAKRVVAFFSPVQVKIFIAVWILISAVAM